MLQYAILLLLARRPLTGYDINKRFSSSIVFFWHARPSQVYGELRRLEESGLVCQVPPEAKDRRRRNVFAITPAGQQALLDWLCEPTPMQRTKDEMQLKAFAFELIEPACAIDLLRQHAALHAERLATYHQDRQRLLDRYGPDAAQHDPHVLIRLISIDYGIGYETNYVRWCEESIGRIRAGLGVRAEDTSAPARRVGRR